MKTQVLSIVTLLCAGLIMSSCQKDNSLVPSDPYEQTLEDEKSERNIGPKPGENDVMADPISNYPDPFTVSTTVKFRVWKPTKVSLIVYNENNERVAILVGQWMQEGDYTAKFNAKDLPAGRYYAVYQVGSTMIKEVMTKRGSIHTNDSALD